MKRGKLTGILGCAVIRVTGPFPEKFINLASAQGIRMWDTVASGDNLTFKTDIQSLRKLISVQEKTGYNIEVRKKSGLLVFAQNLVKRKLLLAGFFCFWLALYYLAGMVWQLDVQGIENLDREEVMDYVRSLGLEKWRRMRQLNLDDIEQQLYVHFPDIAWVAVERSGTRISIRIVEKEPDPLQYGEPIDIVAEYDGIISEMMVLQGIALVQPGMTVAKGDVLISGYRENDGIVNASGYVKAIVYLEGYGEAGLEEVEKHYTGQETLVKTLQLGKLSIVLTRREHGFADFELTESVRFFRGYSDFPVRMLESRYREVQYTTKRYSSEEADKLARNRAMFLAHQQVEEHADLLKTEIRDISIDNIFRYKVTLTIETKIGMEKSQAKGE